MRIQQLDSRLLTKSKWAGSILCNFMWNALEKTDMNLSLHLKCSQNT